MTPEDIHINRGKTTKVIRPAKRLSRRGVKGKHTGRPKRQGVFTKTPHPQGRMREVTEGKRRVAGKKSYGWRGTDRETFTFKGQGETKEGKLQKKGVQ